MKLWPVVNLIQHGRPTHLIYQFLAETFTNVRTSTRNFHDFIFNSFATLISNFKTIPSASSKLLNLSQEQPLKKDFFGQILMKLRL